MRLSVLSTPRVQAAPANPVEHVFKSYFGDRRRLKSDAKAFEKSAMLLVMMGDDREAARLRKMAKVRRQAAKLPRF